MAEENAQVSSAPVESAPVEAAPAEEQGAMYDVDEIADALMGKDETPAEEDAPAAEEKVEAEPAPVEDVPKAEDVPAEDTPAAPDPVMPEGWEDALWQTASPEIRAKIAEQVQAHAAEVSAVNTAMNNLKAEQEQFATQANAQLQQALSTMQQVIEGEFRQVDWDNLAQTDPASYVQLQRMYQSRMQAVQQIQQGVAKQVEAYNQQRAAEAQKALQNEYAAVMPEIKAMIGAKFEPKTFAKETADYLLRQGFSPEAVNNISKGAELKTIVKAMLYDRLSEQRAKAAVKVAEAPKVTQPRGTAKDTGNNDRLKKAMSFLNKNPNSTDAAAAVFEQLF